MRTLRKIRNNTTFALIMVVFIIIILFISDSAHAEEVNYAQSGDGWSISNNEVMTIESNQGWAALEEGYSYQFKKLVIGRGVTTFGLSNASGNLSSEADSRTESIIENSRFGESIYTYDFLWTLRPSEIVVEEGNPVFRVSEGLLINTATNELVLSEMDVTDVLIPEGVQSIAWKAFCERPLKSIQFAKSVREIGAFAFAGCAALTSVILPDSINQIGICAFIDCEALEQIVLPKVLQQIEAYTFSNCGAKYIEIPANVQVIGPCAFLKCEQLMQVDLQVGLSKIDVYAFKKCYALININLPEGLVSIGEGAFSECRSLRRVIFPNSLQLIGEYTFFRCNLSVLRFPEKLDFLIYVRNKGYITYPHAKNRKDFLYDSVDTVILSGSDYDFGYPAITDAKNVYFLGKPPEDVGQILDKDSVEKIYCSDEFEFQWTRSTVASWVRQRLTILPADQINAWAETTINTTPEPADTPEPTHGGMKLVNTPQPAATPQPSFSPATTAEPEKQAGDPMLFVFAGVLALVIAGIAAVAVKSRKSTMRSRAKSAKKT